MKAFMAALAGALLGAAIGMGPAESAERLVSVAAATQSNRAAEDIAAFCRLSGGPSSPTDAAMAACVAEQQLALKHFLGLWVWFDATKADAERCMRTGKAGKYVDWLKAEACLRAWSAGRPNPMAKSRN